jgi:hypothetical protein
MEPCCPSVVRNIEQTTLAISMKENDMRKIIATTLISLALASSAFAQSGTGGTAAKSDNSATSQQPVTTETTGSTTPDETMLQRWTGAIGDAFFTDSTMTTMRGEGELAANWATLTDAQKEQIRGDCKKFATSTAVCTWIASR